MMMNLEKFLKDSREAPFAPLSEASLVSPCTRTRPSVLRCLPSARRECASRIDFGKRPGPSLGASCLAN
jgi:hypothetical protein